MEEILMALLMTLCKFSDNGTTIALFESFWPSVLLPMQLSIIKYQITPTATMQLIVQVTRPIFNIVGAVLTSLVVEVTGVSTGF
jgi:hypothetical protein